MKTLFYNILVPKFLRNFDDYLLRNYPVVWRTQALFVLFYGLVATPLLFAAGFFYPVDAQHLTVDPIIPISSGQLTDNNHSIIGSMIILSILFWGYRLNRIGFPFSKIKDTLTTLMLYSLCFYVLSAFTMTAIRIGTIVRTAYYWMPEKDLQFFENSGIYPYGFVLFDSDTIYSPPTDTFFKRREAFFKLACKVEDTILQNRYNRDTVFQHNWIKKHSASNRKIFYTDTFDFITLYFSESNWPNSYNVWYRQYREHSWSLVNYTIKYSDIQYHSFYEQNKKNLISLKQYGIYNFLNDLDSTKIKIEHTKNDSVIVYRSTLPYSIENAVRSVKHARQYLNEGIYFYYIKILSSYILLLGSMFYYIPLMNLKNLLIAFLIYYLIVSYSQIKINNFCLVFITISVCYLLMAIIKKAKPESFAFRNLPILLFFTSIIQAEIITEISLVLQAVSLSCVFLMSYVQTLPKDSEFF